MSDPLQLRRRGSEEVLGFLAAYVVARRRADRRKGSLEFRHRPRLSFSAQPDER